MKASSNKRIYKVISLLLKAAILIFSFCYIFYKLQKSSESNNFNLLTVLKTADSSLLVVAFILLFLNWGIEAVKWKLLISPLEKISFATSLRSIFAGVTVSIFMPNRVGEFAGRIFFLDRADKVEATLRNFVGSFMQFLMTFLLGLIAMFIAVNLSEGYWRFSEMFNIKWLQISILVVGICILILLVVNRFRAKFSPRVQSYFKALFDIGRRDLGIVFLLSFIRYSVFLYQYFLVLKAFGVEPGFYYSAILIAITFLITSIIPSFALSEVVTRGAVAASLFSMASPNSTPVIVASLVVWIINLAIPALIGSAFIWKLKFFKT